MPHAGQSSGNCQKYIQYDLLKSYSFRGGAYDSETARRTFFYINEHDKSQPLVKF